MFMTEDQVERTVERKVNSLDNRFMRSGSTMTQEEYNAEMKAINNWAEKEYKTAKKS